eukprot:scaffold40235_cov49-Cyclotella_meneghiniana.AAC.4
MTAYGLLKECCGSSGPNKDKLVVSSLFLADHHQQSLVTQQNKMVVLRGIIYASPVAAGGYGV